MPADLPLTLFGAPVNIGEASSVCVCVLLLQDLVHVCVQSVCVYYCSTYYIQSCLHLQGSQCVLNCST